METNKEMPTAEEKRKAFFAKANENKANFELHKELIAKNIGGWNTDKMRNSSIEHFCQTGKPSGGFLLALIEYAEEYANNKIKLHLSKQAEVIAEKAKTSMQFNFGVSNDAVSKQSILQASEEYINNLK